jgi:hypothetical protein
MLLLLLLQVPEQGAQALLLRVWIWLLASWLHLLLPPCLAGSCCLLAAPLLPQPLLLLLLL